MATEVGEAGRRVDAAGRRGAAVRFVREALFARIWLTLSALLGLMQVVIGHWMTVVFAGREGPGLVLGLVIAAGLVGANLALMPILRRARQRGGAPRKFARAYMSFGIATLVIGMGVLAVWLGALPLAGLLAVVGVPSETAFEIFRFASIGVVGWIVAMLVWGFTGGQSRIQHSEVRVPLEGLHEDHDGLRIVQLSDLHIGNGMEGARLEALVMRTNALSPDVIALTGDIFDFDPSHIESGARGLSGLRARLGVYAVLGNHDTYTGIEQVVAGLERFAPQLQLLRKDLIRLPGEAPLYLAGIDDPGNVWTARGFHLPALDELAAQMPSDGPVLLLVHRPEAFPQASELGFALVLAGHTHGGQIAVPFAPRTLNPARIITSYPRGLYRENGSLLYVNRGVGVAGPALRISCTREIATIRLISRD